MAPVSGNEDDGLNDEMYDEERYSLMWLNAMDDARNSHSDTDPKISLMYAILDAVSEAAPQYSFDVNDIDELELQLITAIKLEDHDPYLRKAILKLELGEDDHLKLVFSKTATDGSRTYSEQIIDLISAEGWKYYTLLLRVHQSVGNDDVITKLLDWSIDLKFSNALINGLMQKALLSNHVTGAPTSRVISCKRVNI